MGPSGGWCPAVSFPPLIRTGVLRGAIDGFGGVVSSGSWYHLPLLVRLRSLGKGLRDCVGYWEPTDCWPCFCFAQQ